MRYKLPLIIAAVLMSATSVLGFDKETAERTAHDFHARKSVLPPNISERLKHMEDDYTGDTLVGLQFIYAYMPLPDIADYPLDFHARNVKASLEARSRLPWGKDVPDREFLHFVLPLRVNNEHLDSSRTVFYDELFDRVSHLPMGEAILEANHWCHEKVTYQPSDGRTSSPLSTVSQAIGRCGEESTFTVAALRSIGIPARQVYTPRWAHTDDNHAWVEAWADGGWHFLGACEPAPVLNLGWFNEPASRGMLMSTNVFGPYEGAEETISTTPITTTINVTSNYAPVDELKALVTDGEGNAVKGAKVNFCLYNYAEFYPVVTKFTDEEGYASLRCGEGDMLIWATDGEMYGHAKGRPQDGTVTVRMNEPIMGSTEEFELTIVPPAAAKSELKVTAEMDAANNRRLQTEDSIRKAYVATFVDDGRVEELSRRWDVPSATLGRILKESRGNGHRLAGLLDGLGQEDRLRALQLLMAVTEKDRRDIAADVVLDHIHNTTWHGDSAAYVDYVLNPRIEREQLTPFKSEIKAVMPKELLNRFRSEPAYLMQWVRDSVKADNYWNPMKIRMNPGSVANARVADTKSRDIFAVALARTAGVPAQIDPVTSQVKYMDANGRWISVDFEKSEAENRPEGNVFIEFSPTGRIKNPSYYYNFSISRMADGAPVQLEFDESALLSDINNDKKPLESGEYMLVSGQRLSNGTVLARGQMFYLRPDSVNTVSLKILQDTTNLQVIGSLNSENLYYDLAEGAEKSILSTTGRGYFVAAIIGGNDEPSTHVLNDLSAMKADLEESGLPIVMLFADKDQYNKFDATRFKALPENIHFGIDTSGRIKGEVAESLDLNEDMLPIIVIADTFNRIVYVVQGYNIGIGNALLDAISKL